MKENISICPTRSKGLIRKHDYAWFYCAVLACLPLITCLISAFFNVNCITSLRMRVIMWVSVRNHVEVEWNYYSKLLWVLSAICTSDMTAVHWCCWSCCGDQHSCQTFYLPSSLHQQARKWWQCLHSGLSVLSLSSCRAEERDLLHINRCVGLYCLDMLWKIQNHTYVATGRWQLYFHWVVQFVEKIY